MDLIDQAQILTNGDIDALASDLTLRPDQTLMNLSDDFKDIAGAVGKNIQVLAAKLEVQIREKYTYKLQYEALTTSDQAQREVYGSQTISQSPFTILQKDVMSQLQQKTIDAQTQLRTSQAKVNELQQRLKTTDMQVKGSGGGVEEQEVAALRTTISHHELIHECRDQVDDQLRKLIVGTSIDPLPEIERVMSEIQRVIRMIKESSPKEKRAYNSDELKDPDETMVAQDETE